MTKKTAAITGATGHIGNQIIRELLRQDYVVKALVRDKTDRAIVDLPIHMVTGDLCDPKTLDSLCCDGDVMFHLAAKISFQPTERRTMEYINIEGTRQVVDACLRHKMKRLIHFSSIAALKTQPTDQPVDESRELLDDNEGTAYGRSKATTERIVQNGIQQGLDAIILSPTAVIGPGDYKPSLLGQQLINFHQQKISWLVPTGYDWIDVRDIAQTAVNSIERGQCGKRYLLTGQWLSFQDFFTQIKAVLNKPMRQVTVPIGLLKMFLPIANQLSRLSGKQLPLTHETLETVINNHRTILAAHTRQTLGHQPRALRETLTDTYQWYVQNGYI